jgi:hypothetical protein
MSIFLNAREWLEAHLSHPGQIGDFASEILNTWLPGDEIEECEEIIEAREAADAAEDKLAHLENPLTSSRFASEFVTTGHDETGDELRKFLDYVTEQDEQLQEIREVLERGGVLAAHGTDINLAVLLAMFVPPA